MGGLFHARHDVVREKPTLRAREVAGAPVGERVDDAAEGATFVGQVILDAQRVGAVGDAREQALALEAFEAVGEDVGRDVLIRSQEVAEAGFAEEQVADEDEGPAIADEVEAGGDGAERARH